MIPLPRILVLVGPTASGKTDIAVRLAERLDGEIISADSRQVYRLLDKGTAKPTPDQRSVVPHHFIDIRTPDQVFTAGEFGIEGRQVIDEIHARKKVPIVAGGSGLYIRSLVDGLFEGPGSDPELREILEEKVRLGYVDALIEQLRQVDPESAASADRTKPRRIIRALEVFHCTGKPLSHHHREARPEIRFTPILTGLSWDRQELYRRIETRCDAMLADGLEQEAADLRSQGYDRRFNALNTVGYAEVCAYQEGEIGKEEMIRLFKQNSRRYAKRQLTWFRRDSRIRWIEMDEGKSGGGAAAEIEQIWLEQYNGTGAERQV